MAYTITLTIVNDLVGDLAAQPEANPGAIAWSPPLPQTIPAGTRATVVGTAPGEAATAVSYATEWIQSCVYPLSINVDPGSDPLWVTGAGQPSWGVATVDPWCSAHAAYAATWTIAPSPNPPAD